MKRWSFSNLLPKKQLTSYLSQMKVATCLSSCLTALIILCQPACSTFDTCHDAWSGEFDGRRTADLSVAMHRGETVYLKVDVYFEVIVCEIKGIDKKLILTSIDPDRIDKEINLLRSSFAPMHVDFVFRSINPIIEEVCANSADEIESVLSAKISEVMKRDGQKQCDDKASSEKSACSMFFQFSLGENYAGLSKFPYWEDCSGIRICGPMLHDYLLAHEVGHYFGLQHTFGLNGDNVSDTPNGPIDPKMIGTPDDPNLHNIMTYASDGIDRNFSAGQMDYMKKCMLAFRYRELYLKPSNDFIKRPLSEEIKEIIFNIK
jgi:hypothetical protein